MPVIACDIGGVVKNHVNDEPIENAVESVIQLAEDPSNTFIFISKCNEKYKQKSSLWLEKYNLSHIKTHYCLAYEDKVKIADDEKVTVMIDDRMQVLRFFPSSIIKIWFCADPKKIEGARKFQPDFVDSVSIARDWSEVIAIIEEINA